MRGGPANWRILSAWRRRLHRRLLQRRDRRGEAANPNSHAAASPRGLRIRFRQVRVWTRPRTASEIRLRAGRPLRAADEDGLLFYFPLDEPGTDTGSVVIESRAYPWFGILGNSAGEGRPAWIVSTAPINCLVGELCASRVVPSSHHLAPSHPHRTILLEPATHGRRPRPPTQAPRRARASNPVPATRGRRPRTRAAPHRAAEATHAALWRSSFSSAPPSPASQASCSPAPCCWMGLIRAPRVSCWRHSASHARPLPGIERTVRRQTSQSLRCPPRAGKGTAGVRMSL